MEQRNSFLGGNLAASGVEDTRRAVRACGIPVVGLSDRTHLHGRLTGWESVDDVVSHVEITYGDTQQDRPWVAVATSRWSGTRVGSANLRMTVEHHMRRCSEYLTGVDWRDGSTTVMIDGQPIEGQGVQAGDRWRGVRCERDGIEITVVARDYTPDMIAMGTITDLEPLLARLSTSPQQPAAGTAADVSPDQPSSDPHRALVDTSLRISRAQAEWRSQGGPAPTPMAGMSSLWKAAVQRHMRLTDESESEARNAVSSMVSQLTTLQREATWFRQNSRLRERAISETLMFCTQLNTEVSSRRAQYAWQQQSQGGSAADYTDVANAASTVQQWTDGWNAWADEHAED